MCGSLCSACNVWFPSSFGGCRGFRRCRRCPRVCRRCRRYRRCRRKSIVALHPRRRRPFRRRLWQTNPPRRKPRPVVLQHLTLAEPCSFGSFLSRCRHRLSPTPFQPWFCLRVDHRKRNRPQPHSVFARRRSAPQSAIDQIRFRHRRVRKQHRRGKNERCGLISNGCEGFHGS